jgi:hypothetical protein
MKHYFRPLARSQLDGKLESIALRHGRDNE